MSEALKRELEMARRRKETQQLLVDASKKALEAAEAAGLEKTAARCKARHIRQLLALGMTVKTIEEMERAIAAAKQPDLVDLAVDGSKDPKRGKHS